MVPLMIRPKVEFSSKSYVRELAIFERVSKCRNVVSVAAVGKTYTFDYHTTATLYIYIYIYLLANTDAIYICIYIYTSVDLSI